RDDILPRLGDETLSLVDVRSPAEFNGEILAPPGLPETAQRAGHIPGAASIPWAQTVREDGTFKGADELRDLYAAKGVTADKDAIVSRSRSCGSAWAVIPSRPTIVSAAMSALSTASSVASIVARKRSSIARSTTIRVSTVSRGSASPAVLESPRLPVAKQMNRS